MLLHTSSYTTAISRSAYPTGHTCTTAAPRPAQARSILSGGCASTKERGNGSHDVVDVNQAVLVPIAPRAETCQIAAKPQGHVYKEHQLIHGHCHVEVTITAAAAGVSQITGVAPSSLW